MKVAEVRWTGRGGQHSRRGPSDTRYNWVATTSDVPDPTQSVNNIEDALYFDSLEVFEVEWTPLGRLASVADGPASEAEAMLGEIGYRQKQKLAKSLGIKANKAEEDLDEALAPEIERLKEDMNR